jgi:hypothetical protein
VVVAAECAPAAKADGLGDMVSVLWPVTLRDASRGAGPCGPWNGSWHEYRPYACVLGASRAFTCAIAAGRASADSEHPTLNPRVRGSRMVLIVALRKRWPLPLGKPPEKAAFGRLSPRFTGLAALSAPVARCCFGLATLCCPPCGPSAASAAWEQRAQIEAQAAGDEEHRDEDP